MKEKGGRPTLCEAQLQERPS